MPMRIPGFLRAIRTLIPSSGAASDGNGGGGGNDGGDVDQLANRLRGWALN